MIGVVVDRLWLATQSQSRGFFPLHHAGQLKGSGVIRSSSFESSEGSEWSRIRGGGAAIGCQQWSRGPEARKVPVPKTVSVFLLLCPFLYSADQTEFDTSF